MESVSRIKEAIAKGEYPIDLDAVADMLLDAFKEMKSQYWFIIVDFELMFEKRRDFFKVIESKLSSTNILLSKPEKLKSELKNFEIFLKEHWPSIFASLNECPFNEDEIKILHALLKSIETLNKKVDSKLDFFDDFQKYMKESIEK